MTKPILSPALHWVTNFTDINKSKDGNLSKFSKVAVGSVLKTMVAAAAAFECVVRSAILIFVGIPLYPVLDKIFTDMSQTVIPSGKLIFNALSALTVIHAPERTRDPAPPTATTTASVAIPPPATTTEIIFASQETGKIAIKTAAIKGYALHPRTKKLLITGGVLAASFVVNIALSYIIKTYIKVQKPENFDISSFLIQHEKSRINTCIRFYGVPQTVQQAKKILRCKNPFDSAIDYSENWTTAKQTIRYLSNMFHPDKKGGDSETMKIINSAHSVLKDFLTA